METQSTHGLTVERLAKLLRETEQAHGQYEAQLGRRDEDWPNWYAAYLLPRLQAEGTPQRTRRTSSAS